MAIMAAVEEPITLKEVQLRLGVPQHVLIHLCEKGVIVPDFADTAGRGKRREFSRRNLFEFAVALALRSLDLPVATAALVVRLLRSFEHATAKAVAGFELLEFAGRSGTSLALHFYDGDLLVLGAAGGGLRGPLLVGAHVAHAGRTSPRPRVEKLSELPPAFEAHLELDLARIAQKINRNALL
jgi:DNA-binding transcriptional MerR regulator